MLIGIALTTEPAPLELAAIASHMITSSNLFNASLAFRAVSDISVWSSPTKEILINYCITTWVPMPNLPALKAHLKAALTLNSIGLPFCNEMSAVWPRAPSKIRIHVHIYILFELEILLVELLRAKFSDVLTCILSLASCICTFYNTDLAIGYVEF